MDYGIEYRGIKLSMMHLSQKRIYRLSSSMNGSSQVQLKRVELSIGLNTKAQDLKLT
jgi:hypothetical protein